MERRLQLAACLSLLVVASCSAYDGKVVLFALFVSRIRVLLAKEALESSDVPPRATLTVSLYDSSKTWSSIKVSKSDGGPFEALKISSTLL